MIKILLKLCEPLHLAASHTVSPMAATLDYIPGTALRGALAGYYLDKLGDAVSTDFQRWFLHKDVRFGPCYPLPSSSASPDSVLPLPITAFTCKLHPGYQKNDLTNHGVRDMLTEFLSGGNPPNDQCNWQDCEAHLVPFSGFYSSQSDLLIKPSKRFETRTAIDSRTETAAQQQLYSLEVLEENQYFGGLIDLSDPAEEANLIQQMKGKFIHCGAARTRGFGMVQIISLTRFDPDKSNLLGRVQNMPYGMIGQEILFSITLLSDCIVWNQYLRPAGKITPVHLGQYLHPTLTGAIPRGEFCRTRLVDGWNAVQKNPRPTEIAICAGSVFVFSIQADASTLAGYLANAERTGLGERTCEGFGQIKINNPFHQREVQR